jgi:hypothetical protein
MPLTDGAIDFVAYDRHGQVVLLGEAKSSRGTSEKWAAQFRRNLLSHRTLPYAPFFLIATPEHLYFWRQDRSAVADEMPNLTIDAKRELKSYFEKWKQSPETIGEQRLEFFVWSWLTDLAQSGHERAKQDASIRWLSESGLLDALEKGRVEINLAQ